MFVWDEGKRLKVLDEHRVDLALITDIFDDPNAVFRDDLGHSENEIRYTVIGITAQYGLVFLVFTYRDEKVRFLTARRAEKWMVKDYERRL
ncbi:MAG TPA: BrnT family toxin [Pyrinomonadaceae bacterium]|nr:BrnT family toxin [Pyrinomonadaceae bacterium]